MEDVVIVGGGPGGLYLAWKLAEKGMNVTVLEKKQEIGILVRCAEAIGRESLLKLGIEPNRKWIAKEVYGARLYAPSGKYVEFRTEDVSGYVIERKIFEKELAKKAARAGARVLAKSEAIDLIKEGNVVRGVIANVMGEEAEIRAKVTVSAEGFEAIIARKAGVPPLSPEDADKGFEYEMVGIELSDPDVIHLYFDSELAPRGYFWVFPKGNDCANVGIGVSALAEKTAKEYLHSFMEKLENEYRFSKASIIEVKGGGIPVGGITKEIAFPGFLAIGDAAHQVHPLHGGGMAITMESARIAADVIEQAIEDPFKTTKYRDLWWERIGKRLSQLEKFRRVFEKLTNEDFNFLAENLDGKTIVELSSGKKTAFLRLIKLLKRPSLLKLLGGLI